MNYSGRRQGALLLLLKLFLRKWINLFEFHLFLQSGTEHPVLSNGYQLSVEQSCPFTEMGARKGKWDVWNLYFLTINWSMSGQYPENFFTVHFYICLRAFAAIVKWFEYNSPFCSRPKHLTKDLRQKGKTTYNFYFQSQRKTHITEKWIL